MHEDNYDPNQSVNSITIDETSLLCLYEKFSTSKCLLSEGHDLLDPIKIIELQKVINNIKSDNEFNKETSNPIGFILRQFEDKPKLDKTRTTEYGSFVRAVAHAILESNDYDLLSRIGFYFTEIGD